MNLNLGIKQIIKVPTINVLHIWIALIVYLLYISIVFGLSIHQIGVFYLITALYYLIPAIIVFILIFPVIFKKIKPSKIRRTQIAIIGLTIIGVLTFWVAADILLFRVLLTLIAVVFPLFFPHIASQVPVYTLPEIIETIITGVFAFYTALQADATIRLIKQQPTETNKLKIAEYLEEKIPTNKQIISVTVIAIILFLTQFVLNVPFHFSALNTIIFSSIIAQKMNS